ncbi:DUF6114 domain-containing protein [Streptomyces sp. NPDC086023]|uniref:DUF6114 domain-containing protein n=1 Tax=Streptomyces sp. NPDC086023 TaxID=3365746 RepID=UPI0037D48681
MAGAWRRWRRSRPFWGGLVTVLAGAEISVLPLAPLKVMLHQGVAGIPSVLMGLLMILMGLTAWFAPHHRSLAGIVTALLACAALVLSNLGGFLIGTVLGIVGGGLTFAWRPVAGPVRGAAAGAVPGSDPGGAPGSAPDPASAPGSGPVPAPPAPTEA